MLVLLNPNNATHIHSSEKLDALHTVPAKYICDDKIYLKYVIRYSLFSKCNQGCSVFCDMICQSVIHDDICTQWLALLHCVTSVAIVNAIYSLINCSNNGSSNRGQGTRWSLRTQLARYKMVLLSFHVYNYTHIRHYSHIDIHNSELVWKHEDMLNDKLIHNARLCFGDWKIIRKCGLVHISCIFTSMWF